VKAGYYTLVALSLVCFGAPAQAQPEKSRSIYLKIKGPEESVAKLRAMFKDVALKKELFIAEDPHNASSQVSVTIVQERQLEKPFYAEVVAATPVSREGDSSPAYSCKKVTDGSGYSTITTKSGKVGAAKSDVANKTVWIERTTAPQDLVEAVTREIVNADFQVVPAEKDAEYTLKGIRLMKQRLRVTALEAKVQSVLSPAHGSSMTLAGSITSYLSVLEPISAEAEGCRDSLRHISDHGSLSYQQIADLDIELIAQHIK